MWYAVAVIHERKGEEVLKEIEEAAANYIEAHGYQTMHDAGDKKRQVATKRSNNRVDASTKQVKFRSAMHRIAGVSPKLPKWIRQVN